jgi:NAD(P)-dependent dehydrogenase (short-subunit alcohol dehydrogenase family)
VATTDAIKAQEIIPDVIVNNAGIGRWLFIEETSLEEMRAITAVPYFAAFAVTKAFIAEMTQRGSGNICNINAPARGSRGRARSPMRRPDGRYAASPPHCGSTCGAPG